MNRFSAFDWRAVACRPLTVVLVWAVYCCVRLALIPLIGGQPVGPDDYMRLFEVRDLLAGQSWWDVTQYRIDPPQGASMHWSRLVDLPLAAVAAVFGETAALVAVPLLYLLPALFALRAIMQRLGFGPLAMIFGLLVLPLFPLLPGNFAPFSIDHHAPQAVLGLGCAALLLQPTRLSAALCGVLAAVWLAVSLEGLPMAAALAALFGLSYFWGADRRLPWFLGALALATPALSLATRPLSDFALGTCDIVLPGHMAGFAAAALVSIVLSFLPWQERATGRFAGLALIGLAALPVAFVKLGECAANPFSGLDPVLQRYWYGMITEGLPVWRQPLSVAAMLVWTAGLVAAGWRHAVRKGGVEDRRALTWTLLALLALAACAYSLLLMREGVIAQLLTIPFAAHLLASYLPRARAIESALPRIAATLACLFLLTPTFASGAIKPLDPIVAQGSQIAKAIGAMEGGPCDYTRLAMLPEGRIFAPLDNGPEILGVTSHTIVAASYHRNQQRMREVILAFVSPPKEAQSLVRGTGADYLVACSSTSDLGFYRSQGNGNFANAIFSASPPAWLEPLPGFEDGSLRVFRVR